MSVNFFINSVATPFVSVSFASYDSDPGLTNICSIVNYTSNNVDINENMLKVACYMSFTFTSFMKLNQTFWTGSFAFWTIKISMMVVQSTSRLQNFSLTLKTW